MSRISANLFHSALSGQDRPSTTVPCALSDPKINTPSVAARKPLLPACDTGTDGRRAGSLVSLPIDDIRASDTYLTSPHPTEDFTMPSSTRRARASSDTHSPGGRRELPGRFACSLHDHHNCTRLAAFPRKKADKFRQIALILGAAIPHPGLTNISPSQTGDASNTRASEARSPAG